MCRAFVSTPMLLIDDGKAQITVNQFTKHLLQLNINTVDTLEAKVCMNQVQNFRVKTFKM